jgi:hypothetical protein
MSQDSRPPMGKKSLSSRFFEKIGISKKNKNSSPDQNEPTLLSRAQNDRSILKTTELQRKTSDPPSMRRTFNSSNDIQNKEFERKNSASHDVLKIMSLETTVPTSKERNPVFDPQPLMDIGRQRPPDEIERENSRLSTLSSLTATSQENSPTKHHLEKKNNLLMENHSRSRDQYYSSDESNGSDEEAPLATLKLPPNKFQPVRKSDPALIKQPLPSLPVKEKESMSTDDEIGEKLRQRIASIHSKIQRGSSSGIAVPLPPSLEHAAQRATSSSSSQATSTLQATSSPQVPSSPQSVDSSRSMTSTHVTAPVDEKQLQSHQPPVALSEFPQDKIIVRIQKPPQIDDTQQTKTDDDRIKDGDGDGGGGDEDDFENSSGRDSEDNESESQVKERDSDFGQEEEDVNDREEVEDFVEEAEVVNETHDEGNEDDDGIDGDETDESVHEREEFSREELSKNINLTDTDEEDMKENILEHQHEHQQEQEQQGQDIEEDYNEGHTNRGNSHQLLQEDTLSFCSLSTDSQPEMNNDSNPIETNITDSTLLAEQILNHTTTPSGKTVHLSFPSPLQLKNQLISNLSPVVQHPQHSLSFISEVEDDSYLQDHSTLPFNDEDDEDDDADDNDVKEEEEEEGVEEEEDTLDLEAANSFNELLFSDLHTTSPSFPLHDDQGQDHLMEFIQDERKTEERQKETNWEPPPSLESGMIKVDDHGIKYSERGSSIQENEKVDSIQETGEEVAKHEEHNQVLTLVEAPKLKEESQENEEKMYLQEEQIETGSDIFREQLVHDEIFASESDDTPTPHILPLISEFSSTEPEQSRTQDETKDENPLNNTDTKIQNESEDEKGIEDRSKFTHKQEPEDDQTSIDESEIEKYFKLGSLLAQTSTLATYSQEETKESRGGRFSSSMVASNQFDQSSTRFSDNTTRTPKYFSNSFQTIRPLISTSSEFHSTQTPKKQLRFSSTSSSFSSSPPPPLPMPNPSFSSFDHSHPYSSSPPQSIRRWSPKYSRDHRYLSTSTSASFLQSTASASASSSPNDLDSLYFFLGNVYAGVSVKCSQNTSTTNNANH